MSTRAQIFAGIKSGLQKGRAKSMDTDSTTEDDHVLQTIDTKQHSCNQSPARD